MKLQNISESFPGQPEEKDIIVAADAPFKMANKEHDENIERAEEAFKENEEAVELVSGDNTKEKDGEVVTDSLKKMHLAENLFSDLFESADSEKLTETFRDREKTKFIYDLMEEEIITPEDMVEMFLAYLSDEEVGRFIDWYSLDEYAEENFEESVDKEKKDFFPKAQCLKEECDKALLDKVVEILNAGFKTIPDQAEEIIKTIREWGKEEEPTRSFSEALKTKQLTEGLDEPVSISSGLADGLFEWGRDYDPYDMEEATPEDVAAEITTLSDLKQVYSFIDETREDGIDDPDFAELTDAILEEIEKYFDDPSILREEELEEDFLDTVSKKVFGIHEEFSLNEAASADLINDIITPIMKEYPGRVDIYNTKGTEDDPYVTIQFEIEGDWKHDHLAFRYWMNQNAEELTNCTVKYGGETELEEDGSDYYTAYHEYYFIPTIRVDSKEEEITEEPAEETEEVEFDDDSVVAESLKFQIAKEQIKRFNEGKMPDNWSPNVYLENLVKRNHITEQQKQVLEEAFLNNKE